MGRALGFDVWVASNDRSREYAGGRLGDGCLDALPAALEGSPALEAIRLIDVLWLGGEGRVAAAFEVERGNVFFRKQDYPRALQAYHTVASKFDNTPAAPEALYWMGRVLEATNKPADAIDQLTDLLARYPDAPVAARTHLALGNLSYTLEKWDEAVRQYRTIVDNPQADSWLHWVMLCSNNPFPCMDLKRTIPQISPRQRPSLQPLRSSIFISQP